MLTGIYLFYNIHNDGVKLLLAKRPDTEHTKRLSVFYVIIIES